MRYSHHHCSYTAHHIGCYRCYRIDNCCLGYNYCNLNTGYCRSTGFDHNCTKAAVADKRQMTPSRLPFSKADCISLSLHPKVAIQLTDASFEGHRAFEQAHFIWTAQL